MYILKGYNGQFKHIDDRLNAELKQFHSIIANDFNQSIN